MLVNRYLIGGPCSALLNFQESSHLTYRFHSGEYKFEVVHLPSIITQVIIRKSTNYEDNGEEQES